MRANRDAQDIDFGKETGDVGTNKIDNFPLGGRKVDDIAIVPNPVQQQTIMVWCFSDAGVDL